MILDTFHGHPLINGFEPADLESLGAMLHRRAFDAGEVIIAEGADIAGLYLLDEGVVDVRKQTEAGDPHVLATFEAQSVLGEIEFLSGSCASASVVGKTSGTTFILPRNDFDSWMKSSSACAGKLTYNMGCVLARRLEATNLALVKLVKPEQTRDFEAFRNTLITEWNF